MRSYVLQGEMQDTLKALSRGLEDARTEQETAEEAGRRMVVLEVTCSRAGWGGLQAPEGAGPLLGA